MKKIIFVITIFLFTNYLFALNICCTTYLLENVAKDIGGNKVNVETLVTVFSCPGHIEISTQQFEKAKNSDLLFYHGFENYIKKINNPNTINFGENGEKNLLIPQEYIFALEKTYKILCQKDPKNKNYYTKNFKTKKDKILKLDKEIKSKTKYLKGKNIICSVNNKPLLQYFGFNVIATYPKSDQITPKTWNNIYKTAKKYKITYCIDNYQSGKNTSLQLSKDIKSKHFWTSNFPCSIPYTETMEATLKKNLEFCLNGHN